MKFSTTPHNVLHAVLVEDGLKRGHLHIHEHLVIREVWPLADAVDLTRDRAEDPHVRTTEPRKVGLRQGVPHPGVEEQAREEVDPCEAEPRVVGQHVLCVQPCPARLEACDH